MPKNRKECIMKTTMKRLFAIAFTILLIATCAVAVFAASPADAEQTPDVSSSVQDAEQDSATPSKAIAAGICVGLAAIGGALGMGYSIAKSSEGISRQPEADGKIRTNLMIGLVFIETAIIYALVVAILIIFVL